MAGKFSVKVKLCSHSFLRLTQYMMEEANLCAKAKYNTCEFEFRETVPVKPRKAVKRGK